MTKINFKKEPDLEVESNFADYDICLKMYYLGFDRECFAEYHSNDNLIINQDGSSSNSELEDVYNVEDQEPRVISAITYPHIVEWFDKHYKLRLDITHNLTGKYQFTIFAFDKNPNDENYKVCGKWNRFGYPLSFFERNLAYQAAIKQAFELIDSIDYIKNNL